ncbi:helicase associated domain-containing protein [Streptomyces sp. NPDC052301]|uniref:helicase associated domain-containing protein n=1 Tax=Streptomyces sp. NPDC052301 TaxID=3365687 RepID=UPI0037D481AF
MRQGHLRAPRKHTETVIIGDGDGEDSEEQELKLGAWISNRRSRAAPLTPERIEQPAAIGMRWT